MADQFGIQAAAFAASNIQIAGLELSVYRPLDQTTRTVLLRPMSSKLSAGQFLPEGAANQSALTQKLFHALPTADIKQGDIIRQFPSAQPFDWRVLEIDIQYAHGTPTKMHVSSQRVK